MRKIYLLLFLCISGMLAAQTQLDSLTVTANRHTQSYSAAGRSISVINAEQIQNLPVSTVDELLRYVAGVNLNSRGPFGVQSDIGMRGSTFAQVLVLIDNVRLNDPLTAHFNNYIPIPLSEIDRIEVIRGPAAAAYGADAVGGVIHIQTKIFRAKKVDRSSKTAGQLSIGDHQLRTTDLSLSTGMGSLMFTAGMKSNRAAGEELINPNFPTPSTDSLYNNSFDLNTYTLAAAYIPNRHWKLQWRSSLDQREFAAKYFYTASIYDESREAVDAHWHQINVQRHRGAHQSQLSVGYKKTEDLFTFNPLFTANQHELSKLFLNISHGIRWNDHQQLTLGIQSERQEIQSTDRGDHQKLSTGIYAIYGLNWRGIHSNASLRLENDQNFGIELIPQLAVSYAQNNWLVQSSIGRAVRAADFTERFISHQIPNLSPGRNLGNPDLLAERSYTADIGLSRFIGATRIQAGLFHRWSTNLIDYSLTNSNLISNATNLQADENYLYALNISESTTTGLEFIASTSYNKNKLKLEPILSYTYLSTSNADSVVSKYLANHPTHNIALQLMLTYRFFFVNLGLSHIERESEEIEAIEALVPASYSVLNMRAGLQTKDGRWKVFTNIYNLSDVSYQEILGAQMPGRWISYGISWNL